MAEIGTSFGTHGTPMTSIAQRPMQLRDGLRSFLLYAVLIALIVLAFLGIGFAVYGRSGEGVHDRWDSFSLFTLALFGLFVGDSRKVLRKLRFWLLAAILLAGHLVAFAMILSHVEQWEVKSTWVGIIMEYPLFLFLRNTFITSR